MDLSFLIPSKIRRMVLQYFVNDPESQVYVRELARELNTSPQLVYRELLNLENWGFLFSSRKGNLRVFRLNKKFPFLTPIQTIFKTNKDLNDQEFTIANTLDWKALSKKYDQIPISKSLDEGLRSKRKRPRSYEEEKILKKKGLL